MTDDSTASKRTFVPLTACLTLTTAAFVLGALHPTFPWMLVFCAMVGLAVMDAFDVTTAIWKGRGLKNLRRPEWTAIAGLAVAAFAAYSVLRSDQRSAPPIPEPGAVVDAGMDWNQRVSPDGSVSVLTPKDWRQENPPDLDSAVICLSPKVSRLKAFVMPIDASHSDVGYWADYVVESHSSTANSYRVLESSAGRSDGRPYAERIVRQSYPDREDVTLVTTTLVDDKFAIAVVVCHPEGYVWELPVLRRVARSVRPHGPPAN